MENNTISNLLWGTLLAASWGGMYYWGLKRGESVAYQQGLQDGFAEGFLKNEGDTLNPVDPVALGAIYRQKHDLFTTHYKAACNDGLYSSAQGRGSCTKHGGVKRYI
ncbi:MAG: hypothetical protein RLZZ628_4073 [Bacteroidota bacterium]|jgi:hypothetical protein